MNYVDYFTRQAENLFKDYQERTTYIDKIDGNSYYNYKPKHSHLDFNNIVFAYHDLDEDNFTIQETKDIIADICGYEKWEDLLSLSDTRFEIAKLIFENSDQNIFIDDFKMYLDDAKGGHDIGDESELELLKIYIENAMQPGMPFINMSRSHYKR